MSKAYNIGGSGTVKGHEVGGFGEGPYEEGMWLRWKDGKGKADAVHN